LSCNRSDPESDTSEVRTLALAGAERVVRECLGLHCGESLALFYDETTRDCAEVLKLVARQQGICLLERFVPLNDQVRAAVEDRLFDADEDALEGGRAILLCFAATLEATPYRKQLVKTGVRNGRLGTMPGATLEVLAHAVNVDYRDALSRCSNLALAMLAGDDTILTSYLFDREGYRIDSRELHLKLGGRIPITSPGIIEDGTWGNLPGGETFIAPIEARASGTFVLNGAFTGHVLPPWSPVFLHFENGTLLEIEGTCSNADALRKMIKAGQNGGGPLGLAELGIGVNPGVGELKGNALFDEKKEGTAHIAVGDNSEYGGRLVARIHEDFITSAPSLAIDGRPVLSEGKWVLREEDWRENYARAVELGHELPEHFLVQRSGLEASEDAAGRLRVRRDVGAKRVCIYTVGTDALSSELARVYRLLPEPPNFLRFGLLCEEYEANFTATLAEDLRGFLAVLVKQQLAAIREADLDD
jgi:Thermophilic metalloprotease (M29)